MIVGGAHDGGKHGRNQNKGSYQESDHGGYHNGSIQ